MRVSDAFPSNFLKASDLRNQSVLVKMDHVEMQKIGDDERMVLFFLGKERGLVLNKTNANNIAAVYGDETADWRDQEIVLFPAMVDFQGKTVQAIRVRAPQAKDRQRPPQQRVADPISTSPQRMAASPLTDDEIPF